MNSLGAHLCGSTNLSCNIKCEQIPWKTHQPWAPLTLAFLGRIALECKPADSCFLSHTYCPWWHHDCHRHHCQSCCLGQITSGSSGPWGPGPLAPKIELKSCSFQAIVRKTTTILNKFLAWAPLTKVLDLPLNTPHIPRTH